MKAMFISAATGERPVIKDIKNELSELQSLVEGYIETLPWDAAFPPEVSYLPQPKGKGELVIICNEEGKILNLPGCFRTHFDIIFGNILIVNTKGDRLTSLTKNQIHYLKRFFEIDEEEAPEWIKQF